MRRPDPDDLPPRLIQVPPAGGMRCRCGTRSGPDRWFLKLVHLPESVASLFADEVFCSVPCVRARFLETLCDLDRLDTPSVDDVVSDLRTTYLKFAATFAVILEQSHRNPVLGYGGPLASDPTR